MVDREAEREKDGRKTSRRRNVETKSWVDKKREERIPARDRDRAREREEGKETYGFDYKPMMSCTYVR